MAVEDFMPVKDVKMTIEKEVKPKKTLAELTTVESPGKSALTDSLDVEEKPKKRRARKKKETAEPSTVKAFKGNSILVITEKPQAAEKIAQALGKAKKFTENGASYFELERNGKKILVASAVGHLFNLEYKPGQKGWPIFELEWRPSYEKSASAFTRKYYSLLQKLARGAGEIVVATDYDIEGEVIGWNVLRFICKRDNAKRMKYSTLTKNELERSFNEPMPELDWGHAYAGETRHVLDWLYGINLSRALMSAIKTTGSFKILSIGRVQGPALKIIVDREKEIENFKPVPYWEVIAIVEGFDFKHPEDIFDEGALDKFKNIKTGEAKTKETNEKVEPPCPFDLTTLQREAYNLHKISPSQTLAIAQKLYLDGVISYPRTSSQKIPEAINPKEILNKLALSYPQVKEAKRTKPVEGPKSDPAHPSIYPTGEITNSSGNDRKIYELIVKRFISAFCPDALTENTRVVIVATEDPSLKFSASGIRVVEKGWTKVYPSKIEDRHVPKLNGKVGIDEIKFVSKETQPPKRYSPASLISLLEKKNLGTKATRSSIVDTLFDRGYLDGRSIKATPLGMKLIDSLEKYSPIIVDENLTRQFEDEMEKLQEIKASGNLKLELFEKETSVVEKAKRLITDISKEFKSKENEIGKEILKGLQGLREETDRNNTLCECPTCKKGQLRILYSSKTKRSFIACSAYPNCKQTYSLPPNSLIKKSGKDCPDCRFPKLISLKRGKRPWEFCFNPECSSNKKRREEWVRKKNQQELTK